MLKEYRVTISFGDGNPKTTTIKAKSGYDARVRVLDTFAGARQIHVLGLVSNLPKEQKPPVQPQLVYGEEVIPSAPKPKSKPKVIPVYLENNEINPIVLEAVRLRKEGLSQVKIAKTLGISRETVRRFLNANI